MKTDVCRLKGKKTDFELAQRVAEKTAVYNELSKKQALQLRLLSEELVGMLPELLNKYSGEFWIENKGNNYEVHAVVNSAVYDIKEREKVMSLSSSGKNVANAGFMGKIRSIVDSMMLSMADADAQTMSYTMNPYYIDNVHGMVYSTWSLEQYKEDLENVEEDIRKEKWDELEKSIVANLADNVVVGIEGRQVNIVLKKRF